MGRSALAPPRDTFGSALNALRQRLRGGVDAPGEALPIRLIAAELRISTTPVREALARLAGERLVDKVGPTYTRPKLDAIAIAELYRLRWVLLEAALSARAERNARPRRLPARPPPGLEAMAPGEAIEALFLELVLRADDLMLAQAYQATAQRLAPLLRHEAQLVDDGEDEARLLTGLFERGDGPGLKTGARRYHQRRILLAASIFRASAGEKYRPDMI
ncbi:MAG: GntR family transcriptional regulator [Caulobacter sp.]